MKLSVIIVNYNVEYFLEQCLHSVYKALKNVEGEVYVVDNISVDGSVEMVRKKFPDVHLIANKENVGFSRANNQAIKLSKGEYVLLLNPDTVVEEDTFEKVVKFMDEHPDAGGLGVKMIDGKGKFLPESKRGLPTPAVAFYKIFGLSRLFPKNKKFSKYHLGYLDENETHEIEILAGAFMLMRKTTLDKVGLLDEAFFMYGEDIDLSYRITLGGYKNYYFPDTRIIHYKGESTKKSSVNYVFVFYNAMIIFAQKHFSEKNAKLFSFLINCAIYLRASIALFNRFIKKSMVPLLDGILITGGLFGIAYYYDWYFQKGFNYQLLAIMLPSYMLVWLLSVFFSGGYDKPLKLVRIIKGLLIGTGIILIVYALLSKDLQFSRILILIGAAWAVISMLLTRWILHLAKVEGYSLRGNPNKRFAIVGDREEADRVTTLLNQTANNPSFIGSVQPELSETSSEGYLGSIDQITEIVQIHKIDEVIFCAKNLTAQRIIDSMSRIDAKSIDYKIAPPESLYMIGSNSIETSGDLYVLDINSVTRTANMRNKRVLDFFASIIMLAFLPVSLLMVKNRLGFISNLFSVMLGKKSWVGYGKMSEQAKFKLPKIKPGVLSSVDTLKNVHQTQETIDKLNVVYAKDYRLTNDIMAIWKGFKSLGN